MTRVPSSGLKVLAFTGNWLLLYDPCRLDFSRADSALMALSGRATCLFKVPRQDADAKRADER